MVEEKQELIAIDESIKDLTVKYDDLIDRNNKFLQIFTRAADPNANSLVEFHSVDEKSLATIAERMPEINRATRVFGRQNSQATGKLMSLSMIAQSPYRRLKQALAKIERKRGALKENIFKLRREKIALDRLVDLKNLIIEGMKEDPEDRELYYRLQEVNIDIEEKVANIGDTNVYIEAALKEIGMYQDAYNEIIESYNIPENWDENDFEKAEIEEHVKTAFLHAVHDVEMTGRLNCGTHEYLMQYGINPHTAYALVRAYLSETEEMVQKGNYPDINRLYGFLDNMHEMFKDQFVHAMKRIGLKKLISEDFLYKEGEGEDESIES